MTFFAGMSDLSQSWSLQRHSRNLRSDFDKTATELTTGLKTSGEIARAGDTGRVLGIDRSLSLIDRFRQSTSVGALRLETTQSALQSIRTLGKDISLGILSLVDQDSFQTTDIQAEQAVTALQSAVSNLNTHVAGQSLFAGAATDTAAVVDAATLQADVEAILSAAPDVPTALANIDFYFNDPTGGYLTASYLGDTQDGPDITIGEGETVAMTVRADDATIREALRNLAIIAALSNDAYGGTMSEVRLLLKDAAETGLNTDLNLTKMQEKVGFAQERVEAAAARNNAERTRLQVARNDLASVDPYEAASRFEELQSQIETLYTVTARRSSLSLVNFLR